MNCSDVDFHLPAYLSNELDASTAEDVRRHIEGCSSCAAKLRTQEEIAEALPQLCAAMPQDIERRIAVRLAGFERRRRFPLGSIRVWSAAGALIAIALVASLSLLRQQPVTAAEVLMRAQAAANARSWHIVYKDTKYQPNQAPYITMFEEWYRAPDRLKYVQNYQYGADDKPEDVAKRQTLQETITQVVCGQVRMSYSSRWNAAQISPESDEGQRKIATQRIAISVEPVMGVPKFWKNVHLAGTVVINGRLCDVVEGTGTDSVVGDMKISYAVDRETGLALRRTQSQADERNGRFALVREAVSWELDKPVPDSAFDVKPPKGAFLVKGNVPVYLGFAPKYLKEPSGAAEDVFRLVEIVRARQGIDSEVVTPYAAAYIPANYKLFHAAPIWDEDGSVCRGIQVSYVNLSTGDSIVIAQTAKKPAERGRVVSSGDLTGRVWTGDVPYTYSVLTWAKYGYYFTLTATSLTESEMLRVACSMQRVPKFPPIARRTSAQAQAAIPRVGPKPSRSAGSLDFYYIRDIRSAKNPKGKWHAQADWKTASSVWTFTGPDGETINSATQPKQVLDEVVCVRKNRPILTIRDVMPNARLGANRGDTIGVSVDFYRDGGEKFARFTRNHVDEYLAIFFDGKLIFCGKINEPISNGRVEVSGLKREQAQRLVDAVNSGR